MCRQLSHVPLQRCCQQQAWAAHHMLDTDSLCSPPAGTTSEALTKERPWLQAHLSTIASGVAVVVGALILLAGFGLNVPFFG